MLVWAMICGFLVCLVMAGVAQASFAGPVQDGMMTLAVPMPVHPRGWGLLNVDTMMAASAPIVMKDETGICGADAVLSCRYGAGLKQIVLPWGLRRAGAGVALTIFGADISVQRSGLKVSKSVTF